MKLIADYTTNILTVETPAADNAPSFAKDSMVKFEGELTDENLLEAHEFLMEQKGLGKSDKQN